MALLLRAQWPSQLEYVRKFRQKKATMCDALCHAIESFWSVNSTEESKEYSKTAIQGVLSNMDGYLSNTEDVGNAGMLMAAHVAGKAINITQTTAVHAMCYKITSLFGVAHGHAAMLCDRVLYGWMIENVEKCIDPRGQGYLKNTLDEIGRTFGAEDSKSGAIKLKEIFDNLQFEIPTATEDQYETLKTSVNLVRLKNKNDNKMLREEIILHIVKASGKDPIVSTTGKASRELFETRVANDQSHKYDFLTVGSMGHSSSIALGVALYKPEQKIWCIDGDGAVLMHMGAMAVVGSLKPRNLIHVVINNGAHETVGGMPTVAESIDLVGIAKACDYPYAVCVDSFEALDKELEAAQNRGELSLIEVKCSIGAREDLGRPTTTALENKQNFMEYLDSI